MRIIALKTLKSYWAKVPNAEQPLKSWYAATEKAQWKSHNELKEQFGKASIINKKRVVFDIHGNKYRLIVDIEYLIKQIYIVWVGTHAEYDKINVEDVKYKRFD
jgi:mRNA interferase HigB